VTCDDHTPPAPPPARSRHAAITALSAAITITAPPGSQPGGCDDHTHDHTWDHTHRAALAAARVLAEMFPDLPRRVRVVKAGGRWVWTCSLCAPPVAGSTTDPAATWANVAAHMSRVKCHHEWVIRNLGPMIGRVDRNA